MPETNISATDISWMGKFTDEEWTRLLKRYRQFLKLSIKLAKEMMRELDS